MPPLDTHAEPAVAKWFIIHFYTRFWLKFRDEKSPLPSGKGARKWIPRLSQSSKNVRMHCVTQLYLQVLLQPQGLPETLLAHPGVRTAATIYTPFDCCCRANQYFAGDLYFMRVPQRVKYLRRHAVTLRFRMQRKHRGEMRTELRIKLARLKNILKGGKCFFRNFYTRTATEAFNSHFGIAPFFVLESFTPSRLRACRIIIIAHVWRKGCAAALVIFSSHATLLNGASAAAHSSLTL